ncbi:MAG: T9SS type A sorting domain-containing protein [Rhodothermales bacterium]
MKTIYSIVLCLFLFPTTGFSQSTKSASLEGAQNPWTPVNAGLTDLNVWSLASNAAGVLFAGTNGGIFRSEDAGDNWEAISNGLTALTVNSEDVLFAGTHTGGVFRSNDNGITWEAINSGLSMLNVGALTVDHNDAIYAGTSLGGYFQSIDNGDTWVEINNAGLGNPFVPSLAMGDEDVIYSGTDNGVHRSSDAGATWEPINTGLENPYIEFVLPIIDGALFAGTDGGVYRSLDSGSNWVDVNNEDLDNTNVRAMAANSNNAIFAGTHGNGVLRSLNYGDDWEALNEGLTHPDINALLITASGAMFAGTVGGGIFRRDAATDVSNESSELIPTEFVLAGNYPNPFTTTTTIRFALPESSEVTLDVFDVSGRSIAQLAKGTLTAGWHKTTFDATTLPSGVYFYRLLAAKRRLLFQMQRFVVCYDLRWSC